MKGNTIHLSNFYTSHFGKGYYWTVNPETGRACMIPMSGDLPGGVGPMPATVREMDVEISE